MKKSWIVLLLLCALALILTACAKTQQPKENETSAEHTHSWTAVFSPTCTEDIEMVYICSECGETKTETVAALGHDYTTEVIEPTCTDAGYTVYTCSRCGHVYYGDETPKIAHEWDAGAITTPATDEVPGEITYTCLVCGAIKMEGIPSPGHDYNSVVTAPTCSADGFTTHTCQHDGCENSYVDAYVPALGHTWNDGVITDPPTCTEDGEITYTCDRCQEIRIEIVPLLGHEWDEGVVTVEPDKSTPGLRVFTCTRCGEVREEEIPATGGLDVHGGQDSGSSSEVDFNDLFGDDNP